MFPTKISAGAGEEAAEMDGRVVQQELSEQQLLGVQGDQGDHTVYRCTGVQGDQGDHTVYKCTGRSR